MKLRRVPGIHIFNKFPVGAYDQAHVFNIYLDSKNQPKLSCPSLEHRLEIISAKYSINQCGSRGPCQVPVWTYNRATAGNCRPEGLNQWVLRKGFHSREGRRLGTLLQCVRAIGRQAPSPRHRVRCHAFFLSTPTANPKENTASPQDSLAEAAQAAHVKAGLSTEKCSRAGQ